jgi:hypothetical protein
MRLTLIPLLALASLSSLACSTAAPSEDPVDALDDALSAQDFDTTVQQLSALPWLPWKYLTDGCYARALYYSMLLSSKGVPTNHLYVFAKSGAPPLAGIWAWHVAPMVTKDGDPDHLYVLDPAYDQTKALTNVEWVAKQNYANPAASNYPNLYVAPGNSYLNSGSSETLVSPASPEASEYKEPEFSEMPKFNMDTVRAACDVMHDYINRENTTDAAAKNEKHKSLGRETQRLVTLLTAKDKISGNTNLPKSCTRSEPNPANP